MVQKFSLCSKSEPGLGERRVPKVQAMPWSVRLPVSSVLVQKISSKWAKYAELLAPYARKAGQPASPSGKVKARCLSVRGGD